MSTLLWSPISYYGAKPHFWHTQEWTFTVERWGKGPFWRLFRGATLVKDGFTSDGEAMSYAQAIVSREGTSKGGCPATTGFCPNHRYSCPDHLNAPDAMDGLTDETLTRWLDGELPATREAQ